MDNTNLHLNLITLEREFKLEDDQTTWNITPCFPKFVSRHILDNMRDDEEVGKDIVEEVMGDSCSNKS